MRYHTLSDFPGDAKRINQIERRAPKSSSLFSGGWDIFDVTNNVRPNVPSIRPKSPRRRIRHAALAGCPFKTDVPQNYTVSSTILLVLLFVLLLLLHRPHLSTYRILELLPPRTVQLVAQFTEVIHFTPAVTTPFTPSHINDKVPICLLVMETRVLPIVSTGTGGKTVDLSLRNEGSV